MMAENKVSSLELLIRRKKCFLFIFRLARSNNKLILRMYIIIIFADILDGVYGNNYCIYDYDYDYACI